MKLFKEWHNREEDGMKRAVLINEDRTQAVQLMWYDREGLHGEPYLAMDSGYHSAAPLYDHHEEWGTMDCDLLEGGQCYYDGSTLNAESALRKIMVGYEFGDEVGDRMLWYDLLEHFNYVFDTEHTMEDMHERE